MNDEMKQFEERLRRQSMRQAPAKWRAEILSATYSARPIRHSSFVIYPAWFANLRTWLSALLWPHPKAWAALAAVWICIFGLNLSMREAKPAGASKSLAATPVVAAELRQQQKMFADLVGATELRVADRRPLFSPKPRSERMDAFPS